METYYSERRKTFMNLVRQIKDLGYRVFVINDKTSTYGWVTDGTNIGYIQLGDYGYGLNTSTVHKPCREYGTGFGLNEEAITEIKDKDIKRCFCHHPKEYNRDKKLNYIIKYDSWDEFLSKHWAKEMVVEIK